MKRKGEKKIPTKQDDLLKRWNKTKDCCKLLLEEYIKNITSLHDVYKKDNNGLPLIINIINQMMNGEDDVEVGGATSIMHPNIMEGNGVEV